MSNCSVGYCAAGQYGQDKCISCEDGYYKSEPGSGTCQECTGNYTSNDQRTACDECE